MNALAEDLAGNLWLAVGHAGAMRLSREGFTTFGRADGLHSVYDVFEDRDGHLCFRGFVLGDPSTTSVFEGAPLPLVSAVDPFPWPRLGCFDGQRFEVFTPARFSPEPRLGMGRGRASRYRPAAASGGWARRRGCSSIRRPITSA